MNKRIYPPSILQKAVDDANANGDRVVFTLGEIQDWNPGPDPIPGIHQVVFTPEDFLPRAGVMGRVEPDPKPRVLYPPKVVLDPDVVEYVRAAVALRVAHKANIPTKQAGLTEIELVQAIQDATRGYKLAGLGMQVDRKDLGTFLWTLGLSPEAVNNAIRAAWEIAFGSVSIQMPLNMQHAWMAELENWIRTEGKPEETSPDPPVVAERKQPPSVVPWTEWAMDRLWCWSVLVAADMKTVSDAADAVVWALRDGKGGPLKWPAKLPDAQDIRHAWDAILAAVNTKQDVITMGDPAVLSKALEDYIRRNIPNAKLEAVGEPEEKPVSVVKSRTRASLLVESLGTFPIQKIWYLWENRKEGFSTVRYAEPLTAHGRALRTLRIASGTQDPIQFIEDVLSDREITHEDLLNAFLEMADRKKASALAFVHKLLPPATREYFRAYFETNKTPGMEALVWAFSQYTPGATNHPVVPREMDALRLHGITYDLCRGKITSDLAIQLWIQGAWNAEWVHPKVTRTTDEEYIHNENFVRNWIWLSRTRLPGHSEVLAFDTSDVLRWVTPEVFDNYWNTHESVHPPRREEGIATTFELNCLKILAHAVTHGYLTREKATAMWVEDKLGTVVQYEKALKDNPNPYTKEFVKEWDLLVKSDPKVRIYETDEDFIPEAVRKQARYEAATYPEGKPTDAQVAVSLVWAYRAGAALSEVAGDRGVVNDWEARTVRPYRDQEKGLDNPTFKTPIFAWWWISLATSMTDREDFLAPIVEVCGPRAVLDGFRLFLERTSKEFTAGTATARAMVKVIVEHDDEIRAVIEDPEYDSRLWVRDGTLPPVQEKANASDWLGVMWDDEVGEESTTGRDILNMLLPSLPHQTTKSAAQLVTSVLQGSIAPVEAVMWWGQLRDIQGWEPIPPQEARGVGFALVWLELAHSAPHMMSLLQYLTDWVNRWDIKEALTLHRCGIRSERSYKRRLPDKTEHSESFRNLVWDLCRGGCTLEEAVAAFKRGTIVTRIPQIPTSTDEWIGTALDLAEATGDDRAYVYLRLVYRDDVVRRGVHEWIRGLKAKDDKIEAEVTAILEDGTPNERNSQPMATEITPEQAESGVGQATLVQGFVEGKINIPTVLKAWEDKAMGLTFTTGAKFQSAAGSMTMTRHWLKVACFIEDATSRYRFMAPMRDWTGGVVHGMDAALKDGGISGQPTEGPTMGSELALCALMMVNGTWDMAFASGRMESVQRGLNAPTMSTNWISFTREVAINWMRLSLIQGNGLGLDLLEKWASRNVIRGALMTFMPTIAPRGYDWETSGPAGMWLTKENNTRAEEDAVMDVASDVRNITAAEIVLMVHLGELTSEHAVNKWNHGKPWTQGVNRRIENVLTHATKKDGSRLPFTLAILRQWLQIASNTPNPKVFTADILTYTTLENLVLTLEDLAREGLAWANPEALLTSSVLEDLPARVVLAARKNSPEQVPATKTGETPTLGVVIAPPKPAATEEQKPTLSTATVTLLKLGEAGTTRENWDRFRQQWAARSANQTIVKRETMGTLPHEARVDLARKAVIFAAATRIPVRFMEGILEDRVALPDELAQGIRIATDDVPLTDELLNHLIRRTNYAVSVGKPNGVSQSLGLIVHGTDDASPTVMNARYVELWCGVSVALGFGLQVPHLRMLGLNEGAILDGIHEFFSNLLPASSLRYCAIRAVESKNPWDMAVFARWIGDMAESTVNTAANLALMVSLENMTLEEALKRWMLPGAPAEKNSSRLASEPYSDVYGAKFLEAWNTIVAKPRYGDTALVPAEAALRFVRPDVYCPPAKGPHEAHTGLVNMDDQLMSSKGEFYIKREPTNEQRLMAVTLALHHRSAQRLVSGYDGSYLRAWVDYVREGKDPGMTVERVYRELPSTTALQIRYTRDDAWGLKDRTTWTATVHTVLKPSQVEYNTELFDSAFIDAWQELAAQTPELMVEPLKELRTWVKYEVARDHLLGKKIFNLTAKDKEDLNRSIQDALNKGNLPNVSLGYKVGTDSIPNVDAKVKSETINTTKKELNATWEVPEDIALKAQHVLDALNTEVVTSPQGQAMKERLLSVLTPLATQRVIRVDDPTYSASEVTRVGSMPPRVEVPVQPKEASTDQETEQTDYKGLLNLDPEVTKRAHQTAAGMVCLVQDGNWTVAEAVDFWMETYPQGYRSVVSTAAPKDPKAYGEGFVRAWVRVAEAMESATNPTNPVLYTVFKQGLDVWADPAAVRKVFGDLYPEDQTPKGNETLHEMMQEQEQAMVKSIQQEVDEAILGDLLGGGVEPVKRTLGQKALDTLREDAKAIALRTGVRRVREAASARLGAWWARHGSPQMAGETEEEYARRMEAIASGSNAFLGTSGGEAALSMLLGFVWTVVGEEVTDDNVRGFGDAVARELRVSGGVDLVGGFMDEVVGPMVSSMKQTATQQMGTGVRVFAGSMEVGGETLEFRQNQEAPDRRKA